MALVTLTKIKQLVYKKRRGTVLLDKNQTEKTREKLKTYYANHGYFKARVNTNTRYEPKKAVVEYLINKGKPFKLDSIKTVITDTLLLDIYNSKKDKSYLKKGQIFKLKRFKKPID